MLTKLYFIPDEKQASMTILTGISVTLTGLQLLV